MKRFVYLPMILVLTFLFDFSAVAQYKIVNYTDMNQINSLTEDGDYIWVSTSGGAFKRKKSDGSLVKVINTDNSGISRNGVRVLFIDFFGNYWFGTNNGGISKFDGINWTTYKKVAGVDVWTCDAITSDLNGDLWFGINGGVLKLSNNTWKFFSFGGYFTVNSVLADDLGNVWASIPGYNDTNCGLWKINSSEILEKIPGPGNYFSNISGPYCLHKDNNNNVWMGGYGSSSLIKYNNNTGLWTEFGSLPAIHTISQDNVGNMWLGNQGGVIKYNGTTFSPSVASGRTTGFNPDLVMDILTDAQGTIWLGSYIGLARFNQVANAWTTPILLNCLPSNYSETVVFDSNNKAWIYGQFGNTITFDGSFWGAVANNSGDNFWWMKKAAIDNADNKYVSMPGSDKKLRVYKLSGNNNTTVFINSDVLTYTYAQEIVRDLKFDPNYNKIWIATNQGLFSCTTSGSWTRYNQAVGGLRSNNVTGLAIKGSKVWYSTSDNGIGNFDQSTNTWQGFSTSDGLPDVSAGDMAFDPENNLWIISSKLVKYDGISFSNIAFPGGLYPSHIACDLTGNIWLGGYGGVVKYKDGKFRKYTTEDGLIENAVGDIVVDHLNNVWVPTGYYGLTKLVPQVPDAEFSSNTACLPGSTILTNLSSKTDDLTTFEWDINNDGTVEYTTRDAELIFPGKGIYDVKLKATNDDLFSEIVHQVNVLEAPDVSLSLEGDYNICFGGSQEVQVILNNPDPNLVYQVNWNNGIQGTQQIWASDAGEYYAVVNNGECESQTPGLNLQISEPFSEEKICMVTVDTETGKNLIVWKRTHDVGISSYNVYKLFGNSYVPIGNVSSLEPSLYTDYSSTPEALAARYAISSIDTCGNESPKSPYHQTIQLGASIGSDQSIVLDWTNYIDESKIWQPEWYFIYRGNDPLKLELIDSIATAFTEWNDKNPGDNRYYQVLIKKSQPCDPAELSGKKTSSGPFVHSLSNLEDNRLQSTGIKNINTTNSLRISPNPMNTESLIRWENPGGKNFKLLIFDLKGTVVRTIEGLNSEEYILKRESLSPGCYILELRGNKTVHGRLLVN